MIRYYVKMIGIPKNTNDKKKDIRYFHFLSFDTLTYFINTFEIPNCYYHYTAEICYEEID